MTVEASGLQIVTHRSGKSKTRRGAGAFAIKAKVNRLRRRYSVG
jgi:hypothetical protein